jgi:hypothetical protein
MLTSDAGNLAKLKSLGKYSEFSVVEKQQNRGADVPERPRIANVPPCDLYSYYRDAMESGFGRRSKQEESGQESAIQAMEHSILHRGIEWVAGNRDNH